MKYPLYLLAALALCACTGPEGSPNGQPYAGEPGGTIAVRPEPAATPRYDTYAAQPLSAGMRIGEPVLNPPPVPAPLYQPPSR